MNHFFVDSFEDKNMSLAAFHPDTIARFEQLQRRHREWASEAQLIQSLEQYHHDTKIVGPRSEKQNVRIGG